MAADPIHHALVLEFERTLTEAEWTEVAEYAASTPYVVNLRATAIVAPPFQPVKAVTIKNIRAMYHTARTEFRAQLAKMNLDETEQAFAEGLISSIGEISPDEALNALGRFLTERSSQSRSKSGD